MKKLVLVLLAPMVVVLGLAVAGISGGCGLLEGGLEIDLPNVSFDFSLDTSSLRGQLEAQCGCSLAGGTVPEGIAIQQTFPVEIPPQQQDLSNNADLKKYIEGGKVKKVTVNSVKLTLASNTLTFDLPSVDLYMGPMSAASTADAAAKKIAVLPAINAGTTGLVQVQFTADGKSIMSQFLLSYQFALLGVANIAIDIPMTGGNRGVPSGAMAGVVTVSLSFTVDPL
jgi:hypothetical protein